MRESFIHANECKQVNSLNYLVQKLERITTQGLNHPSSGFQMDIMRISEEIQRMPPSSVSHLMTDLDQIKDGNNTWSDVELIY